MKSSNWMTNVILLLLLFALSIITYKTNQQNERNNTIPPVTNLIPESASFIHINKNDIHTVIEKINNAWYITKPIHIKANQFRIGSILKLLTTNNYKRYKPDELNLNQYGLSNSHLTVKVDDINITFGNTNPINNKRYMLINNSMVLLDDNFFPLVNSQLGTLVDLKLLSDNTEINQIKTSTFTLSKNKDGLWNSTNKTSSDDIITTINNWVNVQAFGVHNYVKRDVLDTITITQNGKEPITFLVTDKEPWLIIARPDLDLEYHLDESNINKLLSTIHKTTSNNTHSDVE